MRNRNAICMTKRKGIIGVLIQGKDTKWFWKRFFRQGQGVYLFCIFTASTKYTIKYVR